MTRRLFFVLAYLLCPAWLATDSSGEDSKTRDPETSVLSTVVSESGVAVFHGDALVLRYNSVALKSPDPQFASYERSGYIHPVRSPSGKTVTGDFAPDHAHQHGLFVAWTKATYEGKPVDFWNQHKGSGIVLHDRVIGAIDDKAGVGFQVAAKHCRTDQNGEPIKILDDIWTVRVRLPEPLNGSPRYEIELSVAQTNVTDSALIINEYHYGGVGFRGAAEWYSDESAKALREYSKRKGKSDAPDLETTRHRFITSEGKDRLGGNHTRPQWAALQGLIGEGSIDNQLATVRVRSVKTNERHPVPVRLHPIKPYFSLSPCVLGEFQIAPGETYRATYLFEIIDGPLEDQSQSAPSAQ